MFLHEKVSPFPSCEQKLMFAKKFGCVLQTLLCVSGPIKVPVANLSVW